MRGRTSQHDPDFDPPPVTKLFMPDGPGIWLLSELDPTEPDRAFGLCDTGHGYPELGDVLIRELQTMRGRLRLSIERDAHITPDRPISNTLRKRGRPGASPPEQPVRLDPLPTTTGTSNTATQRHRSPDHPSDHISHFSRNQPSLSV